MIRPYHALWDFREPPFSFPTSTWVYHPALRISPPELKTILKRACDGSLFPIRGRDVVVRPPMREDEVSSDVAPSPLFVEYTEWEYGILLKYQRRCFLLWYGMGVAQFTLASGVVARGLGLGLGLCFFFPFVLR
jgi:hypothetical protein